MNPVLYQTDEPLFDGAYLPGQYAWSEGVTLSRVVVSCAVRPVIGTLILALEVGGVLLGTVVTISSGADEFLLDVALAVPVAANAQVRWLASFNGLPEEAASEISLTLEAVPTANLPVPALTVRWVDGQERLTLFNYDLVTRNFNLAVSEATADSRATIIKDGDTSISFAIRGSEVFAADIGIVWANSFTAGNGTSSPASPRLEFCVGDAVIATATLVGFRIAQITQVNAVYPETNAFEFWSVGSRVGTLSALGLTAYELQEFE